MLLASISNSLEMELGKQIQLKNLEISKSVNS